jgi:hypothetical protein
VLAPAPPPPRRARPGRAGEPPPGARAVTAAHHGQLRLADTEPDPPHGRPIAVDGGKGPAGRDKSTTRHTSDPRREQRSQPMKITTTPTATAEPTVRRLPDRGRRHLCERCGGDPVTPCALCARERDRVMALYDRDAPLASIAAACGLADWRAAQIIGEERDRRAERAQIAANAELLRGELEGLVDVILAGPNPPAGEGWQFDCEAHWHLWVEWTLELVGWTPAAVQRVLDGTHIPNRRLRDEVLAAQQRHRDTTGTPLASRAIAVAAGIGDGNYLERLLGIRAAAPRRRRGRIYQGATQKVIATGPAARIAEAIGVARHEIPGL